MDFPMLFRHQRDYEKHITYNDDSRFAKVILAFITEIGEALNERPEVFKFWSVNPKSSSVKNAERYAKLYNEKEIVPEGDPFLDELSDVLHFLVSIGLLLDIDPVKIKVKEDSSKSTTEEMLILFSQSVMNLYTIKKVEQDNPALSSQIWKERQYILAINYFVNLLGYLGYSEEQMIAAYLKKNEVNIVRQKTGY